MRLQLLSLAAAAALSNLAFAAEGSNPRPYETILAEAQAAFNAEDYSIAAARLDEAQALRPFSMYLTRNRILARILANDLTGAIEIVDAVADRGLTLELPENEAFDRLRADPAFAPVASAMDANSRPIGAARLEIEFPHTELLPEAVFRTGDRLFIGSVRTGAVLEARAGALHEIARLDGGVFDFAADRSSSTLYAAYNNQLAYEKAGDRSAGAAIATIHAETGLMRSTILLNEDRALLGDIEAADDVIFASDSLTPRIFVVDHSGAASVFAADPKFVNLQGLAVDKKKQRLFVADYLAGLFVIDLNTRHVTKIANPTDAHLGGIDGLYLYEGDLIGVQNGTTPQRIVRIDLARKGTIARSLKVLQQASPHWNEPTHGLIEDDRFLYIATSNWPAYDDNGAIREGAVLQPLRLMSVDLN